ncbi:glycosyltransferase family 4 protein [Nocardioides sp. Iso805N]|uniref:glycosyltransferase family 4 protein n=1 Tax=Nocardioides sp. Iso805N TaxID=1283287 RepID=UPI000684BEA9|nr:glycosyltransferase family 4 protein [Nocardioides sp. Iso805N]
MRTVHLVVPEGVDDPTRPSGGNVYDRRVADGLAARGWRVVEHAVAGPWPWPDRAATALLAAALAEVPSDEPALVDGLVAGASPGVLVPAAARLALGVLVHLPLGLDAPHARPAEEAVLAAAGVVIATSDWTRGWLADHYRLSSVAVAPPGVDPAPPAAGSETGAGEGGALLCVGRAGRAKGYDVLATALETLTDLAWSCVWAGPVEHAAPSRITTTGPLPAAALAERYRAADLLVLPSRHETFGMVLTEALAHGVPVVASDVGGVREAVGRAPDGRLPGLLVPSGEPEALARTLRRWLTDPSLRASLRAAARSRRGTLTRWADTVASVEAALPAPLPRHRERLVARP